MAAYEGSLAADALAMPVHWYYDRAALRRDYGIVDHFIAPRNPHPGSILWRSSYQAINPKGDILREQAVYWGQRDIHYHQFLKAGENTLNFRLATELFTFVRENGGYDADVWLDRYIARMLEPGWHHDTYVEEYGKPWMIPHYSHQAKVWYASGAVWDALFSGSNDPSKAKILLKLLGDNHDDYSQYVVLNQLRFHWNSEVEREVSALARRKNITNDSKELAISVLLERPGDSYVTDALRFVQDAAGKDQSSRFHRVFNIGYRFETFSNKSQADILALGFSILEVEAKPGTSAGYGLACELGTFLRVPEEFKPDIHAPDYQGKGGLNEQFFSDTVRNALEWRKLNPSAFTAKP